MKLKYLVIVLAASGVLPACSVNLARRYSNHTNRMYKPATDPQSFAQVGVTSKMVTESSSSTPVYNVLSLSPEGQAQFIKSLEVKFPDPKEFVIQLNNNFSFIKESKANVKIIPKTVKKELTFTTNRLQYQSKGPKHVIFNLAGDRIAYLELILTIPREEKVIFNSWDRYDTKYVTLNLGKASSSQQFNASATLTAKSVAEASLSGSNTGESLDSQKEVVVINGGTSPNTTQNTSELINSLKNTGVNSSGAKLGTELGGSATVAYTDKFETSQDLTSRIVDLSGTLSKKQLLLRQEGGLGIDLSGNIKITLEYTLTDDWAKPVQFIKFRELNDKDGDPIEVKALKYSYLTVIFPDVKKDVKGILDYSFLYRQVRHGNRHIPEARHDVTFWYGTVPDSANQVLRAKPEFLIEKDDIRPKAYKLQEDVKSLTMAGNELLFENVTDAAKFLHYITELILKGKDISAFKIAGVQLSKTDLANITVTTILQ